MPPGEPPGLFLERGGAVTSQQTISKISPQKAGQTSAALGLGGVNTFMSQQARLPTGIPADENPIPQSHSNRLTPIIIPACRQPLHPAEPGKGNLIDHEDADALGTFHSAAPRHCQLGRAEGTTAPHGPPLHPRGPDAHHRKARQHSSMYQNPAHRADFSP